MNTKELIKFLESIRIEGMYDLVRFNKIGEIIELLQRGEKYEQMWGEIKSKYGTFFRDTEEGRCLGEMMAKMEYEYFPEPKKKTITIEIEGEDNVDLQLATVIMKKAVDDFHIPKINFKVKEIDNEIKKGRRKD